MHEAIRIVGGYEPMVAATGIPRRTLAYYASGESEPKLFNAVKIAHAAGRSIEWLASGGHPNVDHLRPLDGGQVDVGDLGVSLTAEQHAAFIPRYAATLSAGNGTLSERAELLSPIPFAPDFFGKKLGRSADGMVIVDAVGESMEPVIGDGDLVMIDTAETQPREAIFAVALGEELFVKRLARRPHGIDLLSENPHYPPMVLEGPDLADLQIIGRVVWIGRTLAGPGRM